jgi:hypothetical protein
MKKNRSLLLLLAVLVLGALAWYSISSNLTSTFNSIYTKFQFLDTASLTKIFLAHKDGRKNTITKQGNIWLINNRTIADGGLMRSLLKGIHDIDVKRPVSSSERAEVVRSIATQHIKVELYAREGLLKTYYVGQDMDNHSGSVLLMEGAEEPYIGFIPGFEGVLAQRFDVKEEDWRDKHIFRTNPSILQKVSVNYPGNPQGSFSLTYDKGNFTISNVPTADSAKTQRFLQELAKSSIESWVNPDMATLDSITQIKPMLVITLENKDGIGNETLTIWDAPDNPDRYPAHLKSLDRYATVQKFQVAHFAPKKDDLTRRNAK